jgi:hypothetical protein
MIVSASTCNFTAPVRKTGTSPRYPVLTYNLSTYSLVGPGVNRAERRAHESAKRGRYTPQKDRRFHLRGAT